MQGCKNGLADCLIRLQVERLRQLIPSSRPQPEKIPVTPIARGHFEDMTHKLNSVRAPSTTVTYKQAWKTFSGLAIAFIKGHCSHLLPSTFVYALGYAHRRFAFPDPTSALTAEVYDT